MREEEEVNFEIDPHIIMMARQTPIMAGELLKFDDEIQTSSP